MTTVEALQQARRRWGEAGHAQREPGAPEVGRFRVGERVADVFIVRGVGQSWEEAFRAADEEARKPP